jgi:microcystin degradation protein MlrC
VTLSTGRAGPRVALVGFFIECNRWSPTSTAADFQAGTDLAGDGLAHQLRATAPRLLPDMPGFVAQMDELAPGWEPVPIRMAGTQPGGPVDHTYFSAFLADVAQRLADAGPVDAVYLSLHGAALTTEADDPDARLAEALRREVGQEVPIVAVLDLHANVCPRVVSALSAMVAYRTNPHVDLADRGREAARHLHTLLQHGPGVVALVKLPLVPPAPSQLVAPGRPYHDLIALGQQQVGGAILNVSLLGGFALADSPHCGFSVCVSASRDERALAQSTAQSLARAIWAERHRFVTHLTPLSQAVQAAVHAGLHPEEPPLILADVADNPGGGGGGHTVDLLQALLDAGARGVALGVFTDPDLAAQAHSLGVGHNFKALLHRRATGQGFDRSLTADATVLALHDGEFLGRRGMVAGTRRSMGPTALLALAGRGGATLRVVVISARQQLLDPAQLDIMGPDLSSVRTLVVKSRGHFRAAFDDFTPDHRILEVDCPGLTTPNLSTLAWLRLPRPVFPIDTEVTWP